MPGNRLGAARYWTKIHLLRKKKNNAEDRFKACCRQGIPTAGKVQPCSIMLILHRAGALHTSLQSSSRCECIPPRVEIALHTFWHVPADVDAPFEHRWLLVLWSFLAFSHGSPDFLLRAMHPVVQTRLKEDLKFASSRSTHRRGSPYSCVSH